jgi:hypothetical protein
MPVGGVPDGAVPVSPVGFAGGVPVVDVGVVEVAAAVAVAANADADTVDAITVTDSMAAMIFLSIFIGNTSCIFLLRPFCTNFLPQGFLLYEAILCPQA